MYLSRNYSIYIEDKVYLSSTLTTHSLAHLLTLSLSHNTNSSSGQDILWREACRCPTEDQYKQMVIDKTGGLFRLAVGLMQALVQQPLER